MPQAETGNGNQYSLLVGLVFIFNIIVGTGALTLPAAFAKAGWLLGTISILFLAFVSFVTATYVIECMACVNALIRWRSIDLPRNRSIQADDNADSTDEYTPINQSQHYIASTDSEDQLVPQNLSGRYYHLDTKVELGEMATMLFNRAGRMMFYLTMIIYLYGDLSIYSVAISKSTRDVICTYNPYNSTSNNLPSGFPCFSNDSTDNEEHVVLTRSGCYRIILVCFMCALGPFVFFNVQKTKYLQMFTTLTRWLAFIVMISLAVRLLTAEGGGPKGNPSTFDMKGIPALFGSCIYSFMCHHSLPGMITPIRSKKRLGIFLSLDFFLITLFYILLALTGVFAFANLEDLYTLNFIPVHGQGWFMNSLDYFLELFPVFTLTTTFPVLAITLRNTIQNMVLDGSRLNQYNLFLRKICFPIVTIIPPVLVTMFMEEVTTLVSFTGSYAGTGIQYLIPTFLVLAARKQCAILFGPALRNPYESPFRHMFWAVFIILWSFTCVILVSLHFLEKNVNKFH